MERLVSPEEAAEMLGIKVGTLYLWALQKRIPSYKLGRCRRFKPAELQAWIEANRVKSGG